MTPSSQPKPPARRGVLAFVAVALPALYVACSCISGAHLGVTREAARAVRVVRATGATCASPVVKCVDEWEDEVCSLWNVEVAAEGTCRVEVVFASGDVEERTVQFRTVGGCMCGDTLVADEVPAIGEPTAPDSGPPNG
jgi:hypothetical protein